MKWICTGKLCGAVPRWLAREGRALFKPPSGDREGPRAGAMVAAQVRRTPPRLATMLRADAVLRSQVQKTSAYFSRYQVKYRRRREGKTDYRCVRRGARASGSAPGAAR